MSDEDPFPYGFRWVQKGLIRVPEPLPAPPDGRPVSDFREFVPASKLPACPLCNSPAGKRCISLRSGKPLNNSHLARLGRAPTGGVCRGCGGKPRSERAHFCEPCFKESRAATYRRYDRNRVRAA